MQDLGIHVAIINTYISDALVVCNFIALPLLVSEKQEKDDVSQLQLHEINI